MRFWCIIWSREAYDEHYTLPNGQKELKDVFGASYASGAGP